MLDYLIENKEWIFSGIGVAVVSWLFFSASGNRSSMSQQGGDNSKIIQVGGNVTSSFRKDKNGN